MIAMQFTKYCAWKCIPFPVCRAIEQSSGNQSKKAEEPLILSRSSSALIDFRRSNTILLLKSYPVILVPKEFTMVFPYSVLPTTFYADRSGTFLETKFSGAYPEMYEDVLLALRDQQ